MSYIIDGFLKHGELDSYENGCNPDESFSHEIALKFKAQDRDELIELITHHFNVNRDDLQLNACEEVGRIDIQILENKDSEQANDKELEEFKRGECDLWLCTYSGQLEHTTKPAWST